MTTIPTAATSPRKRLPFARRSPGRRTRRPTRCRRGTTGRPRLHRDHHAHRSQRREDRRSDELEIIEGDLRQTVDARSQQAERPARVGDCEHQDGEEDEVGRHRPRRRRVRGAASARRVDMALASRTVGRPAVPIGVSARRRGTRSPTSGPTTPPATIPTDGLDTSATPTATPAPTMAATSSRRPGDQPDREADHRGREDDVDAEAGRIRDLSASMTPASVARFHGMNVPRPPRPSNPLVGPAEPPEVADRRARMPRRSGGGPSPRAGERHGRGATARQRRRIEQVTRVEQAVRG